MRSSVIAFIIFLVLAGQCGCHRSARNSGVTNEDSYRSTFTEEEMYLLYPQLLFLQEKLDEAAAYYYLGDLESSLFLAEDLVRMIEDVESTSPPPPICDQIEILGSKTHALIEKVSEEELERDWEIYITAVLDSIARNHVVEDEIEIVDNWRTEYWLKYFQGKGRRNFDRWLERVEQYRDIIEPILVELELPRDLLFLAVIESGLNLNARSSVNAIGPWQFMAGTARIFGLRINWWLDERKDIIAATYAAGHYLKHLHNLFGSWPLALASYNSGEYRVAAAISHQKTDNYWRLRLPSQTKWFVPKFMAALAIGRDPAHYGFRSPKREALRFDVITIDRPTDLKLVAKAAGCTVTKIKKLNPALKRWATPPNMIIELKVPDGTGVKVFAELAKIPPEERVSWHRHKIKQGETLSSIASKYEISTRELKRINGIKNAHKIRAGKMLMIPVRDAGTVASAAIKPKYKTSPKLPDKITMKRYKAPANHKKIVYTVKDKDTLSEIAEKFHVGLSRLRSWNGLRYSSLIHPGDNLVVYVPPAFSLKGTAGRESSETADTNGKKRIVHVVKKGETLSHISALYKKKISTILTWNSGIRRDRLYPGDRITIWMEAD